MLPGGTDERTNEQGKIGLLSQWKLEAEFRNNAFVHLCHTLPFNVKRLIVKAQAYGDTVSKCESENVNVKVLK